MLGCLLNATGQLVKAAILLKITPQRVDNVGKGGATSQVGQVFT